MAGRMSVAAFALFAGVGPALAESCGTDPAVYDINDGQMELQVLDIGHTTGPYGRTADEKPVDVPLVVMKIRSPEGKEEFIFGPTASWQWQALKVEDIITTKSVTFTGRTDDLFDRFLMRLDNKPDGEGFVMQFKGCVTADAGEEASVKPRRVTTQKVPDAPPAGKPPVVVDLTTQMLEQAVTESHARGEPFNAAKVADNLVQKELKATIEKPEKPPRLFVELFGEGSSPLPPPRVSEPYVPQSLEPQDVTPPAPVTPSIAGLSPQERKDLGDFLRAGDPARWQFAHQKTDRPQAPENLSSDDEPEVLKPVGRLFAWRQVCERYNHTGELEPVADTPGTWFMDDARMQGYESYCLISGRSRTRLNLICEGMGADLWKAEAVYKQQGNEILLEGEEDTPLIACDSL